jgi:beta-N-acetylhexosaminidase
MTPARMAAQVVFPAHRFESPDPAVEELVALGVGGFCLYEGRTADWASWTARLQSLASTPLLFCADFEDGAGQMAAGGMRMPSNMAIAATGRPELGAIKASATAAEAHALGVGMVFAPCVDLNTNPRNPIINIRAFSDRVDTTIRYAAPMIDAYRAGGVLSCLKHFPGHGDVEIDSHISTPVVRHGLERLRGTELAPFAALLPRSDAVMTAHLLVPELDPRWPASVSFRITDDLLRKEMGFDGLVFTDALCMGGIASLAEDEVAVRAIQAGADVLLYPNDPRRCIARLERALRTGEISPERLRKSVDRISRAKAKVGSRPAGPPDPRVPAMIAEASVTLARHAPGTVPLRGPVDYLAVVDSTAGESDAAFREALGEIQPEAENLVVAIYIRPRAWAGRTDLTEEQRGPVRGACRPGRRAVGVSFGSPYLSTDLPELETFACAYSDCAASQVAAARALRGLIPFSGSLPVGL